MKGIIAFVTFITLLQLNVFSITLYQAARQGDCKTLKNFLNGGASIDQQSTETQKTLLHIAAYHGKEDIVKLLLKRKANRFLQDHDGQTPLHAAVIGCANALLGRNINNLRAKYIMHPYRQIIDLLLNFPEDPGTLLMLKDNKNKTALHYAIYVINTLIVKQFIHHCEKYQIVIKNIDKVYENRVIEMSKIRQALREHSRVLYLPVKSN